MTTSRLALLIAFAGLMSQACIIKSSDEGGTGGRYSGAGGSYSGSGGMPATGKLGATWEITGAQTTCGSAWYVDIDVANQTTMADYHDSFGCAALSGVTIPLPLGSYAAAVRLRDETGALLSEAAVPGTHTLTAGTVVDLGHIQFTVAAQPIPDQFYETTWTIYRCADVACSTAQPGELNCEDVGADWVGMKVDSSVYWFTCTEYAGRTATVAAGNHTVSFELQDWWGNIISSSIPESIPLAAGVPVTIPTVEFWAY